MRRNFIEFKDIHKNQDIWIVSAGPSLNYVDSSFFENKITMGIGDIFRVFHGLTYYMRKDGKEYEGIDIFKETQKYCPESKLIFSNYYGCAEEWGLNDFDVDVDYWYFDHIPGHGELTSKWNQHEGKFANGIGTTGIAVHLCAYMGAKNIIICGNDCLFLDNKHYVDGYGNFKGNFPHNELLDVARAQTLVIVNYFRRKGINIHGLNPWVDLRLEDNFPKVSLVL